MELETSLRLEDFNQAIMVNPRNAYQRYNAATNSADRTMHTYMGTLLPRFGNIHYSGSGVLSPLSNDPNFVHWISTPSFERRRDFMAPYYIIPRITSPRSWSRAT
jgi:uncharacterized protein (DUF39 family)